MQTVSNFGPFMDSASLSLYRTERIGDVRKKFIEDGTMSTFNNVIQTVSAINKELANDLQGAKKDLDSLINLLVEINDIGKVELSNIAKDLSNKIVYIYDNLVTCINNQRSENLKLEIEITKATKEKNALRHEIDLLTDTVRKLEVSLGVQKDPAFETMLLLSKK